MFRKHQFDDWLSINVNIDDRAGINLPQRAGKKNMFFYIFWIIQVKTTFQYNNVAKSHLELKHKMN